MEYSTSPEFKLIPFCEIKERLNKFAQVLETEAFYNMHNTKGDPATLYVIAGDIKILIEDWQKDLYPQHQG